MSPFATIPDNAPDENPIPPRSPKLRTHAPFRGVHICMYCSTIVRGAPRHNYRLCLLNEDAHKGDGGHICRQCVKLWPDHLDRWCMLRRAHLADIRPQSDTALRLPISLSYDALQERMRRHA